MSGLWFAALAVMGLVLLLQVRVGVRGEYTGGKASLWARLGFIQLRLIPRKRRKKVQVQEKNGGKKEPPKAKGAPGAQAEKKTSPPNSKEKGKAACSEHEKQQTREQAAGDVLAYAKALLPLILEAAGQFRRKLRVDTLELELRIGARDPGDAALRYGQASAALGAVWLALTEAFHVKNGRATVLPDFELESVSLSGRAELSLKVGQILRLGLYFGLRGLKKLIKVRKERGNMRKPLRKAV